MDQVQEFTTERV